MSNGENDYFPFTPVFVDVIVIREGCQFWKELINVISFPSKEPTFTHVTCQFPKNKANPQLIPLEVKVYREKAVVVWETANYFLQQIISVFQLISRFNNDSLPLTDFLPAFDIYLFLIMSTFCHNSEKSCIQNKTTFSNYNPLVNPG